MLGTVTVSTYSPEEKEVTRTCWGVKRPVLLQRRVQLKRQPVHIFSGRWSGDNLMSEFTNIARFTLKYNEEHLLMPYALPSVYQAVVTDDAPVKIDTELPPVQLVFLVRVMPRCTMLNVAPDTKLAMLLNIGCLDVQQLMLTGTQIHQLL